MVREVIYLVFNMNDRLELYHDFIDAFVKQSKTVIPNWIEDVGYPQTEDNVEINQLLNKLSIRERELIAQMVQDGSNSALHNTLVYLQEEIGTSNFKIVKNGVEIAIEPYGNTMYYDFVCRREGDEWPTSQLDDEYTVL